MKTFREYLEGREVNENFLRSVGRNAAALGLGAAAAMGFGGPVRAETPTTPNQIPHLMNKDMPSAKARMNDKKPMMTAKQLEAEMDQLDKDRKAREDKMTPHEKLLAKVREARAKRGETSKIDINKLNNYVGDTPEHDKHDKYAHARRFIQKTPDDGQRDPRAPRPDPEVEEIMKQVEAEKAAKAQEERKKFLKSMEYGKKRFAK